MKFGPLSVGSIAAIGLGVFISWPQITMKAIAAQHYEVANRRAKTCLVLPDGETVQEGYFYVERVDPKTWAYVDPKTKKRVPTDEGPFLKRGRFLCSTDGATVQIGDSGVAMHLRSMAPDQMQPILGKRFGGNEIPLSMTAKESKRYVPNFSKRGKSQSKVKIGDTNNGKTQKPQAEPKQPDGWL